MEDVADDLARLDYARPPSHGRDPHATLKYIAFRTSEERVTCRRPERIHRSIVADPDQQGIRGDALVYQRVEQSLPVLVVQHPERGLAVRPDFECLLWVGSGHYGG